MKRKKMKLFVSIGAVMLALVSCGETPSSSTSETPSHTTNEPTTTPTTQEPTVIIPDGYKTNADLAKGATSYKKTQDDITDNPLNMFNLEKNSGTPSLNPIGEQRILVLPVGFEDDTGVNPAFPAVSKSGRKDLQTTERLDQIENLFFGESKDTGWQSIKSFYENSSYGKTTITGDLIRPNGGWWNTGLTPTESVSKAGSAGTYYLLNTFTSYYNTEYAKANHGALGAEAKDISWYDQNKDGFIDTVWMVYSCAIHAAGGQSDYWAFVSRNVGNMNSANVASPVSMNFGWASIDFMDQAYGTGQDVHTFAHETGHIFGLDDYYNYDGTSAPMGGIDMMDNNIGDHGAFSKFTLGWSNPYIVDSNTVVTLRSGTETGDAFLVPSPNYNGTAFDEYILVELITPTGLNEKDYTSPYPGNNLPGYSVPGLRITHVDARVYESTRSEYAKTPLEVSKSVGFRLMNTPSARGSSLKEKFVGTDKSMYLTHLIEGSGSSATENCLTTANYKATDASLFTEGFTYNPEKTSFSYFMPSNTNLWNKASNGTAVDKTMKMNFKIKVESIVDGKATVKVTFAD